MLAETGFLAGSIQIAGTDQPIQIPSSSRLRLHDDRRGALRGRGVPVRRPKQKATLKAQDFGKAHVLGLTAVGALLWLLLPTWAVWFSKMVADGQFLYAHVARLFGVGA
jgi:hypothetical protein